MVDDCEATFSESTHTRTVRETGDDPAYLVTETVYPCERPAGHSGDHHGWSKDGRTHATWPVE